MADEPVHEEVDFEEVDWQVDEDGTQYFVDEDGVRWELGDDGYAYAIDHAVEATSDESADPTPTALDETTEIPVPPTGPVAAKQRKTASWPEPNGSAPTVSNGSPVVRIEDATAPSADVAPNGERSTLLELSGVRSGYGKLPVLHGVDFSVRTGETAVLFGLNGAGKTTTAMNVCGALDTWAGSIRFDGHDATNWGTRQAVAHGIVLVPEGRRVFPDLTVERNLQVGAWSQRKQDGWFEHQRDRVFDYFPRLRERREQLAGTLSGGEQQMLAIARGLMANPRLLIIDEASMGLAPVIVKDVFEIVGHINEDGVTVLMIEQNVGALEVADLALVMEQGHIIRELAGDDLKDRSLVAEVLMG